MEIKSSFMSLYFFKDLFTEDKREIPSLLILNKHIRTHPTRKHTAHITQYSTPYLG